VSISKQSKVLDRFIASFTRTTADSSLEELLSVEDDVKATASEKQAFFLECFILDKFISGTSVERFIGNENEVRSMEGHREPRRMYRRFGLEDCKSASKQEPFCSETTTSRDFENETARLITFLGRDVLLSIVEAVMLLFDGEM
jgi:hypothetical protein